MAKATETTAKATNVKLTKNNIDTENFFRYVLENDLRYEAAVLLRAAIGKEDPFGTSEVTKKRKTRKKRGPKAKKIIQ